MGSSEAAVRLRAARTAAGLSQQKAADRLRVSQPYYSQIEGGSRAMLEDLALRAIRFLHAPATILPLPALTTEWAAVVPTRLARTLGSLGYPPFGHLSAKTPELNPAFLIAGALAHSDLDTRIVEGLPWALNPFHDLDTGWLLAQCKLLNLQNRLGYLVWLARQINEGDSGGHLQGMSDEVEKSRLAGERTLCRDSMPDAERVWVRKHRSREAAHWGLLTMLSADQLSYAA